MNEAPKFAEIHRERVKVNPRFENACCIQATFSFVTWLVDLGNQRDIQLADLWPLTHDESPEGLHGDFMQAQREDATVTLSRFIFLRFGWTYFMAHLLSQVGNIVVLTQPHLLKLLLEMIVQPEDWTRQDWYYTLSIAVSIPLITSIGSLCNNQAWWRSQAIGVAVRTLIMTSVYAKTLSLSNASRQTVSTGARINLINTDTTKIFYSIITMHFLLLTPVVTIIVLGLLWNFLGVFPFAVTVFILALTPYQVYLASKLGVFRKAVLTYADERVKVMSEILQGIRVVKYYHWELPFIDRVTSLRLLESSQLFWALLIMGFMRVLVYVWPIAISWAVFVPYALWGTGSNNPLSMEDAIVLLAYIGSIRFVVSRFPAALMDLAQAKVSMQRLEDFLGAPDLELYVTHYKDTEHAVRITQGDFTWQERSDEDRDSLSSSSSPASSHQKSRVSGSGGDLGDGDEMKAVSMKPVLKDINLHIPKGSLTIIVGKFGSGKSSLLQAITGEMIRISSKSKVNVSGNIAYVAQENFIRNCTLRENILFGRVFHAETYEKVVEAVCLTTDLHSLPAGDATEIGERGINLSGGQKARVSLARALYAANTADVFLLDDPLSAVDMIVCHEIFHRCLHSEHGLLKDKTRILVINSHMELLKYADNIIVMAQDAQSCGVIQATGTNDELKKQGFNFYDDADDDTTTSSSNNQEEEDGCRDDDVKRCDDVAKYTKSSSEESGEVGELKRRDSIISLNQAVPQQGSGEDLNLFSTIHTHQGAAKLVAVEDREIGGVAMDVYRTYFLSAGKNTCTSALLIISTLVMFAFTQVLWFASDFWLAIWFDERGEFENESQAFYINWYTVLVLVFMLFAFIRTWMLVILTTSAANNLHAKLLRILLHGSVPLFFDVTPLGRISNRFSKDLDRVDVLLANDLGEALSHGFALLAALVLCISSSYWFLVALFPLIYVFATFTSKFRKSSRDLQRLDGISRSPILNLFSETLNGLASIRGYSHQIYHVTHEFNHTVADNARVFYSVWMTNRWLAVRLDFVCQLGLLAVALLGVCFRKHVDPVLLSLALVYTIRVAGLLQWACRVTIMTDNDMTSAERLLHYTNIPREANTITSHTVPSSWPSEGTISFQQASFRYRPELELALREMTLHIHAHEKIGIVGRTGAGKSSIMIALFRIAELCSGSVLIDNVNIASVSLSQLRNALAIIPQDPVLFAGTLRYNLDPFDTHTDLEYWCVLDRVHIGDTFRQEGITLESIVAENGLNFSQGERQIICIARALLRHSKIIVFDEATASVDSKTDRVIQQSMRENFKHCTVLTIAHRLETILDMDRILVVEKGQNVEFDTPFALSQIPNGHFATLVKELSEEQRALIKPSSRNLEDVEKESEVIEHLKVL